MRQPGCLWLRNGADIVGFVQEGAWASENTEVWAFTLYLQSCIVGPASFPGCLQCRTCVIFDSVMNVSLYIYIIIYHTHHITVVSHETCLLSGPGYDDSLYFFYINRQESQPSNAWFWALHRMLWHLPRLRFRPAALGRLKMAQEWPEPYIGLSERWAKNPGVRSLRSLLGYSCTAMHCNYLGGIDFVFGKQKAINQHFATCTKATNTWPATR